MIDSHCHLNDERFDPDRDEVINRAKETGLIYLVNIGSGYGVEGNYKSLEIARGESGYIFVTTGIHPHNTKLWSKKLDAELRKFIEENRDIIVAIGEVGLDYHYNFSSPEVQKHVFKKMIALAREYELPLVIHSREAELDTFNILKEEGAKEVGGVMHCFSGDYNLAMKYIEELGFFISISGVVTFKKAAKTMEVAEKVPLKWLFAETDSPYLAPVPYRGRRNEPSYVRFVYEKIASLREIPLEEVEREVDRNVINFFSLPPHNSL